MITAAIVTALLAGLSALGTLLPVFDVPDVGNPATLGLIGRVNTFLPIDTFLLTLGLSFAVLLALYAWDFAVWVYHQVWGSS